jgi:hypothetical protein
MLTWGGASNGRAGVEIGILQSIFDIYNSLPFS